MKIGGVVDLGASRLFVSPRFFGTRVPASRLGGQIFCRRSIRPVISNEPEPS
jgi:hypothetical protein